MVMKPRMLSDIIKRGATSISRNRGMSLASIGSVSATLLILGIILLMILNINGVATSTQEQFDQVQAYLGKDLSTEEITEVGNQIEAIPNVSEIEFLPRRAALEDMRESWGDEGYLLEGLEEENPLPHSFIVTMDNIEESSAVVERLDEIEGITETNYYKDVVERLMRIANFIRIGGLVIIGVLIFISVFIISNTIKITVAARRKEIGIMKYVGATNGFIRGPFIVEGIVLGLIGSVIALIIVYAGYRYAFTVITERLYHIMSAYMILPQQVLPDLIIIFLTIGVGIGMLGSVISLKRYLNV
jgi:cell division transport system permease protein